MTIDIDATLVTAHSEKEQAPPAYKTGVRVPSPAGVHRPRKLWLRRARRATVASQQCGIEYRRRPSRTGQGCSLRPARRKGSSGQIGAHPHQYRRRHPRLPELLTKRRPSYSVGWVLPTTRPALYRQPTKLDAWEPAYDTDNQSRGGANIAELTSVLDVEDRPEGMRIIVRREQSHPGAQLRFDDVGGYRLTRSRRIRPVDNWLI
jgi:hypothetical protein